MSITQSELDALPVVDESKEIVGVRYYIGQREGVRPFVVFKVRHGGPREFCATSATLMHARSRMGMLVDALRSFDRVPMRRRVGAST